MLLILKFLVLSLSANAYLGLLTDGEVVGVGEHQLGAESQFVFNKNDGINLAGHYSTGVNEELEFMADLGFGATDFYLGSNIKYVPYPDFEQQPAIGFITGLSFAREEDESFLSLKIKSFASKRFDFDYGEISPYGALSYAFQMTNEENYEDPFHLIFGAKYKHFDWQRIFVYAELGTGLSDTFNYFSLKVAFPLGDSLQRSYIDDI